MQSVNWTGWASGWAITGFTVATVVAANPAAALENWQFNAETQQLEISLPKGVTPRYHLVAEPARIVLDLPNTDLGAISTQQTYSGAVRQIRVAQFQPDLARIVLELSPEAVLASGQVELQPLAASPTDSVQRWTLRPLLANAPSPNRTAATPESIGLPVGLPLQPALLTNTEPTPAPAEPEDSAEVTTPDPAPSPALEPAANPNQPAPAPTAAPLPAAPLPVMPSLGPARTGPVALAPGSVLIPLPPAPEAPSTQLPPLEPGAVEIPVSAAPSTIPHLPTAPATALSQPFNPMANGLPPAELEQATGTAATLAAPHPTADLTVSSQRSGSAEAAPIIPTAGTLSFPTPTAIAVNVPALSTVPQAVEPEAENEQSNRRPDERSRAERRRARQQAAQAQPDAENQPETQNQPEAPNPVAQPLPIPQAAAIQVIPFGQPLPR